MAERFTLSQTARMLGVSRRTLYGWLQDANIKTRPLPTDARAQTLTREQLERLARAHGVILQEAGLVARLEELEARMEVLEAKIKAWEQQDSGTPHT